jgi:ribonuclease D
MSIPIKVLQKPEKIYLHYDDLPDWAMPDWTTLDEKAMAIDTETNGLSLVRDRLCLFQVSFDGRICHLVKFSATSEPLAPNLIKLLEDDSIVKIFHFARFDVAMLFKTFGVQMKNVYCTKIASKLARTYTEKHGLKALCHELLGIEISKKEQSSDWGKELNEEQKAYAACDVLYLHILRKILNDILIRENRQKFAVACNEFIGYVTEMDCLGWSVETIFSHRSDRDWVG